MRSKHKQEFIIISKFDYKREWGKIDFHFKIEDGNKYKKPALNSAPPKTAPANYNMFVRDESPINSQSEIKGEEIKPEPEPQP